MTASTNHLLEPFVDKLRIAFWKVKFSIHNLSYKKLIAYTLAFTAGICLVTLALLYWLTPSESPENVNITDVTDQGFVVTWITRNRPTKGYVIVSGNPSFIPLYSVFFGHKFRDERDLLVDKWYEKEGTNDAYYVHRVEVKNLEPASVYHFRIGSGLKLYDSDVNGNEIESVATYKTLEDLPTPSPSYGRILREREGKVAEGALIFAQLRRHGGEKSTLLSGLTKENGTYVVEKANARILDGSRYFGNLDESDETVIWADTEWRGSREEVEVKPGEDQPVEDIELEGDLLASQDIGASALMHGYVGTKKEEVIGIGAVRKVEGLISAINNPQEVFLRMSIIGIFLALLALNVRNLTRQNMKAGFVGLSVVGFIAVQVVYLPREVSARISEKVEEERVEEIIEGEKRVISDSETTDEALPSIGTDTDIQPEIKVDNGEPGMPGGSYPSVPGESKEVATSIDSDLPLILKSYEPESTMDMSDVESKWMGVNDPVAAEYLKESAYKESIEISARIIEALKNGEEEKARDLYEEWDENSKMFTGLEDLEESLNKLLSDGVDYDELSRLELQVKDLYARSEISVNLPDLDEDGALDFFDAAPGDPKIKTEGEALEFSRNPEAYLVSRYYSVVMDESECISELDCDGDGLLDKLEEERFGLSSSVPDRENALTSGYFSNLMEWYEPWQDRLGGMEGVQRCLDNPEAGADCKRFRKKLGEEEHIAYRLDNFVPLVSSYMDVTDDQEVKIWGEEFKKLTGFKDLYSSPYEVGKFFYPAGGIFFDRGEPYSTFELEETQETLQFLVNNNLVSGNLLDPEFFGKVSVLFRNTDSMFATAYPNIRDTTEQEISEMYMIMLTESMIGMDFTQEERDEIQSTAENLTLISRCFENAGESGCENLPVNMGLEVENAAKEYREAQEEWRERTAIAIVSAFVDFYQIGTKFQPLREFEDVVNEIKLAMGALKHVTRSDIDETESKELEAKLRAEGVSEEIAKGVIAMLTESYAQDIPEEEVAVSDELALVNPFLITDLEEGKYTAEDVVTLAKYSAGSLLTSLDGETIQFGEELKAIKNIPVRRLGWQDTTAFHYLKKETPDSLIIVVDPETLNYLDPHLTTDRMVFTLETEMGGNLIFVVDQGATDLSSAGEQVWYLQAEILQKVATNRVEKDDNQKILGVVYASGSDNLQLEGGIEKRFVSYDSLREARAVGTFRECFSDAEKCSFQGTITPAPFTSPVVDQSGHDLTITTPIDRNWIPIPRGDWGINLESIEGLDMTTTSGLKLDSGRYYLKVGAREGEGKVETVAGNSVSDQELIGPALANSGSGNDPDFVEEIGPNKTPLVAVDVFHDKNGDGVQQENEESLNWAGLTVRLTNLSKRELYDLKEGWNLVSVPVHPGDDYTASKLLREIARQGGYATTVSTYDAGKWLTYKQRGDVSFSDEDFPIVPGKGYFIRVHTPIKFEIAGKLPSEPVGLNLDYGWNLVGIHPGYSDDGNEKRWNHSEGDDGWSAVEVLDAVRNDGVEADILTEYRSGRYVSVIRDYRQEYESLVYGSDYGIEGKKGYFLKVGKGGVGWRP